MVLLYLLFHFFFKIIEISTFLNEPYKISMISNIITYFKPESSKSTKQDILRALSEASEADPNSYIFIRHNESVGRQIPTKGTK